MPTVDRRLRVLVLSWHYPTPAARQRGLWVERMCDAAAERADVTVLVPTPWVPPLLPVKSLARFRQIPGHESRGAVELHFPRVLGSIAYVTHAFDARLAAANLLTVARELHNERPFDLIHAHFVYPDGVVASQIGQALGIPVMTTEHAMWTPWLVDQPRVGSQVNAALAGIKLIAPVSQFLNDDVSAYLRGRVDTTVLPNVVDDSVFYKAPRERDLNELLYVGLIRRVKRVDLLVRALALVRRKIPAMRLRILSASVVAAYSRDRRELNELVSSLGLESAIDFVYDSDPPAVAEAMRRCAFVVVSSTRRETFCSVAAESLACGTPLIITRCGGPEEFVGPADGVMVEADNVNALAEGILDGVQRRDAFEPNGMQTRVVARFGREAWCDHAMSIYERLIS